MFRIIKIEGRQIDAQNIFISMIYSVIEVGWYRNRLILCGPLVRIIGSLLLNKMMHGTFR